MLLGTHFYLPVDAHLPPVALESVLLQMACPGSAIFARLALSVDVSFDEPTGGQTLVCKQDTPQPMGRVGVSVGETVYAKSQIACIAFDL